MKYLYFLISLLCFTNCTRNKAHVNDSTIIDFDNNLVDSISLDTFNKKLNINDLVLNIDTIYHPKFIHQGDDPKDEYMEGYYINGKLLKIYQPSNIDTVENYKNKKRLYLYDNKKIKITRIITDSLSDNSFDFNNIWIDYDPSQYIYKKDDFLILINEPSGWCGLANQYRFVQIFNLKELKCYEVFINLYSIKGPKYFYR